MTRSLRAMPLVLLLVLLLVTGCGMYGSLYLEEEPPRTPDVTEGLPTAADEAAGAAPAAAPPRDEDENEDEEDSAGTS